MLKRTPLAQAVVQPRIDYMPFAGGLDQVTPPVEVPAGFARAAANWAVDINGGYYQPAGYERFDGQPSPSSALFVRIHIDAVGDLEVGDDVEGGTSSATGTIIAINESYDEASPFIVLGNVVGTFEDGEDLEVSTVVEATTTSIPYSVGPTLQLTAQYRNLAADLLRADIEAVPGENPVRGVFRYTGITYAWRDNVGETAAELYKSSSSGWVKVELGLELAFTSGGTYEILDGDVITGATSAATATVTRVVLQSGSWAAGTAVGRLIFASKTGNFAAENLNVGASLDVATIAGNATAIVWLPGGRFETRIDNLSGAEGTRRVYGVDGVNSCWEFDGTVFVPIRTTMPGDAPEHLEIFKKHLFLAFGSSIQHSGITSPYTFSPIFGAEEIAVGDNCTGMQVQPGSQGTMAIFCRNTTFMLYGSSSEDWNLVQLKREVGAYEYTIQELGLTMLYDDRGIATLESTDAYGNFKGNSVSRLVQPFVNTHRSTAVASCISRDHSQYLIFFSDKSALYITVDGNKVAGIMPQAFAHEFTCVSSQEESDGTETIFMGGSDGFVYQLERGTSHDGEAIQRRLEIHYFHGKSPRIHKTFKDVSIEVGGNGYAEVWFTYLLAYNLPGVPQPGTTMFQTLFSIAYWDQFVWDNFIWDGITLSPITKDLDGDGENVSLIFSSNSDYFEPIKFSGAHIRYIPRRQMRNER
jgi:hypothetical protein